MQQWNLMVIGYPPPRHSAHWALRGPGVFLCSDFECFWSVQQEMETHHDHRALRAHIFWFCSTELNSPNSISLRLLFLFSMQVCSMCLVKLLLPTALSLISISFLRKQDWLGDPFCTMLPLSTKRCLNSSKLRPILNGQFCHPTSKNICLIVLGSKQPLVFVIFKL